MKELTELRLELDGVDREIVRLFEQRMTIAEQVAAYKVAHQLPVLDRSREELVLQSRVVMLTDTRWSGDVRALFEQLMALSRGAQEAVLREAQQHD